MAFIQRNFSLEDQERYSAPADIEAPNVLNAWTHGDLFTVHMLGICHGFFTSLYQRNEDTWWELAHVWPTMQDDYGREDAITGYAWTARYALRFLDAYLKHDEPALAYLKRTPAENGVPAHVMAVSYRAPAGAPVSFDAFRSEVIRQGFDHTADVYAAFLKRKPDFKVDDRELMNWSDELIDENHLPEAISLLQLNSQTRPDSADGYASLGDVYRISGETQLAIVNYKKALEKDSMNAAAARRLEQLGASSSK
jgi:tetratricopeptide (TPR) repeat protein